MPPRPQDRHHPPYYRMKQMAAGDTHERLYQDMVAVLNKHARHLTAHEILAIAANMLGKLIALQDQRSMTSNEAMALVAQNIEEGNQQAIDQLMNQTEGRA